MTHGAPGGIRRSADDVEQPGGPQAVADQRELVVGRGDEREAHRALGQHAQHLERGLRGDGLEAGAVERVDRGDDRSGRGASASAWSPASNARTICGELVAGDVAGRR